MSMTHASMGQSGLISSRLIFGTMTFTNGAEWLPGVASVGQKNADDMVAACLDGGINHFDSADGYSHGEAEIILGKALGARRHDAIITTKYGFRQGDPITKSGLSRRHTIASVEGCLKRLGTDYIDMFIIHKQDFTTPFVETCRVLDDLVRAGKIRYIGFSNWEAWQAARALQFQRDNGLAPFIAGQMLYNMVSRDLDPDMMPMMQEMGVGLMAWSPLAQGLLSGKYQPGDLTSTEGRLAEFDLLEIPVETAKTALTALNDIASKHKASTAQTALAWLLHRGDNIFPIIGASKQTHLTDALKSVTISLSADEMETLNAIAPHARRYPDWFNTLTMDEQHKEMGT